jgi:hypothetical protein
VKTLEQRDPSFEWYAAADLKAYRGKYIAIVGRGVAASGKNAKKVYAQARRKHPRREIVLAKVPREDIVFF